MRIVLGMVRMCKCCDGSVVVQVRTWMFQVSGSAKCVTQRGVGLPGSDAIKCDAPRDTVPNNPPMGPLGRAPPQSRSSGPPTRSCGPRHVPPRSTGAVIGPSPGAGVGPSPGNVEAEKKVEGLRHVPPRITESGNEPLPGADVGSGSAGTEVGKKGEASELLQALSLLQSIMSPEDFAKYQVLVAPKPKREKTREQELADRVKSLERLRSQEATHKGQIDKLELDLQRHRDMLQGVLLRIREESEECAELGPRLLGNVLLLLKVP